ncbi:MAG: hypothetical protein QOD77_1638 [Thermoplasmata archaeon]|jgi:hypothetical protein|nr:hypothetical protein [Thermoplasmata archaeon]
MPQEAPSELPRIEAKNVHIIHNSGTMGNVQQGGAGNVQSAPSFEVAKEEWNPRHERAARFFAAFLGELGTMVAGWLGALLGSLLVAGFLTEKLPPQVQGGYAWLVLGLGIAVISGGVLLQRAAKHIKRSRCPSCKKPYALEEVGTPSARDVHTGGGSDGKDRFERTVTRSFLCKECGKETTRKAVFNIER